MMLSEAEIILKYGLDYKAKIIQYYEDLISGKIKLSESINELKKIDPDLASLILETTSQGLDYNRYRVEYSALKFLLIKCKSFESLKKALGKDLSYYRLNKLAELTEVESEEIERLLLSGKSIIDISKKMNNFPPSYILLMRDELARKGLFEKGKKKMEKSEDLKKLALAVVNVTDKMKDLSSVDLLQLNNLVMIQQNMKSAAEDASKTVARLHKIAKDKSENMNTENSNELANSVREIMILSETANRAANLPQSVLTNRLKERAIEISDKSKANNDDDIAQMIQERLNSVRQLKQGIKDKENDDDIKVNIMGDDIEEEQNMDNSSDDFEALFDIPDETGEIEAGGEAKVEKIKNNDDDITDIEYEEIK